MYRSLYKILIVLILNICKIADCIKEIVCTVFERHNLKKGFLYVFQSGINKTLPENKKVFMQCIGPFQVKIAHVSKIQPTHNLVCSALCLIFSFPNCGVANMRYLGGFNDALENPVIAPITVMKWSFMDVLSRKRTIYLKWWSTVLLPTYGKFLLTFIASQTNVLRIAQMGWDELCWWIDRLSKRNSHLSSAIENILIRLNVC